MQKVYTTAIEALKAAHQLTVITGRPVWRYIGVDKRGKPVWLISTNNIAQNALQELAS
jgi:hypothetical protein